MQLRLLGGASEVGSLCLYLEENSVRFIFDCGLTPSKPPKYPIRPPPVDIAFLSHAHIDHSGMIPWLCAQQGVDVIATKPTIEIGKMLLEDSVKVSSSEGFPVPYEKNDVKVMKRHFQEANFNESVEVGNIEVVVHTAGHIPGAAMFKLISDKSVLFTGDINTLDTHLVNGTSAIECDVLVIESTYSGRNHPPRSKTEYEFLEKTREVVERDGLAIVPAFAVGRSQEMLMALMDSEFDIWLDGMGRAVNREFVKMPQYLRSVEKLKKAMGRTRIVRNATEREEIGSGQAVITTSGMLDGGPVLDYLRDKRTDANSAVLLTGFQVEDTNGRRLLDTGEVLFGDTPVKIDCEVGFYDFSAHADHSELLRFVRECSPETVVLCHGDNREALASDLEDEDFKVLSPMEGEVFEV
jgi:putative mRNA 3-end processing factor